MFEPHFRNYCHVPTTDTCSFIQTLSVLGSYFVLSWLNTLEILMLWLLNVWFLHSLQTWINWFIELFVITSFIKSFSSASILTLPLQVSFKMFLILVSTIWWINDASVFIIPSLHFFPYYSICCLHQEWIIFQYNSKVINVINLFRNWLLLNWRVTKCV
jgi:hypothetical protein